jgi:hypothetical protein
MKKTLRCSVNCIVRYKDGSLEMLAPNCGKFISDSSIFCNWCGFKAAQENTPLLVEDVFDP